MEKQLFVKNSLSGKKEAFKPVHEGQFGLYVCGPTVYGPLHMGHARTYIAFDVIKNYIEKFRDEIRKVLYISNITDVGHIVGDADDGEDKIQKRADLEKKHPMEIVDAYIREMWEGLDLLNCDRPNIAPRATGHIPEIIDAVQELVKNGFAYAVDGSVYFDVEKFPGYGKLSGNVTSKLADEVRVSSKDKKRNPGDFALWKKAEPNHIMQWTSPWGMGFPGWHIECSVMSRKYLGDRFDMHGGARELRFPHHENEIAQSECLVGHQAINYWVHTGILMVDGVKMAKSLGNFITVSDYVRKYPTDVARFYILSHHYSADIDLREEYVVAAKAGLGRINSFIGMLTGCATGSENHDFGVALAAFQESFQDSMNDDFNTPMAIASIFKFISAANRHIAAGNISPDQKEQAIGFLRKINSVFKTFTVDGVSQADGQADSKWRESTGLLVENLLTLRKDLRANRDFAAGDAIRKVLIDSGVEVKDGKDGATWSLAKPK